MICSGCGQACNRVHDWEERWLRDLPILDAQTHLGLQRFRVVCATRGPKLERLSGLPPWSRVTPRLAESVARLCKVLPIKRLAEFYGLGRHAVKRIDKEWRVPAAHQPVGRNQQQDQSHQTHGIRIPR